MLLRWFVMLYDLEIIEEEVFMKWREDINDEFPGKGKALFQVNFINF
jgi:translation initiation factor 4G